MLSSPKHRAAYDTFLDGTNLVEDTPSLPQPTAQEDRGAPPASEAPSNIKNKTREKREKAQAQDRHVSKQANQHRTKAAKRKAETQAGSVGKTKSDAKKSKTVSTSWDDEELEETADEADEDEVDKTEKASQHGIRASKRTAGTQAGPEEAKKLDPKNSKPLLTRSDDKGTNERADGID